MSARVSLFLSRPSTLPRGVGIHAHADASAVLGPLPVGWAFMPTRNATSLPPGLGAAP